MYMSCLRRYETSRIRAKIYLAILNSPAGEAHDSKSFQGACTLSEMPFSPFIFLLHFGRRNGTSFILREMLKNSFFISIHVKVIAYCFCYYVMDDGGWRLGTHEHFFGILGS